MNPFSIIAGIIFISVVVVIFTYRIAKKERRELIDELWKDGKITDETYKEYISK